jgi:hypothetical protein
MITLMQGEVMEGGDIMLEGGYYHLTVAGIAGSVVVSQTVVRMTDKELSIFVAKNPKALKDGNFRTYHPYIKPDENEEFFQRG